LKHGRRVAIKTIHPKLTSEVGPIRFEREIWLTANLQHPLILP
jgi:serine/threonine-protein kinase